ncbi:MAG: biotin synthase BioB [Muribaculaceae bacterium]
MLIELKNKILAGEKISFEDAELLSKYDDVDALCDAANEIRERMCGVKVDTCSIINARSGRCSENCKWCAQSHQFATGVDEYEFVDEAELMDMARHNDRRGVHRFSLVTSGRKVSRKDIVRFCGDYRRISAETDLYMCASMGLLGEEELLLLKDAGVKRYHCNLETSESNFANLCSTHTSADKKRTIKTAKAIGMDVCSGGIIGMGETMNQRIELAFELRELGVDSVPINILNPIKGTALEDTPLISDDEIMRTVAVFRFILPTIALRFAGGRARLSKDVERRIFLGGMNGALIGDMLTTIGNRIDDDYALFDSLGLTY